MGDSFKEWVKGTKGVGGGGKGCCVHSGVKKKEETKHFLNNSFRSENSKTQKSSK